MSLKRFFLKFSVFFTISFSLLFSCNKENTITVLTASGLKEPFNQIVELYQKQHPNVEIKVIYGGSGELLAILSTKKGDLFIPAGEFYTEEAAKRKLIDTSTTRELVKFVPVLVVKEKFLKEVKSLKDLTKVELKLGIGDPKAASIGRVSLLMFQKLGIWNQIEEKIVVKTPTVSQLLLYLKTGQIDATIIWKHLTKDLKGFGVIEIPPDIRIDEKVEVSISSFTENRMEAERFERFLLEHKDTFKRFGF